MYIVLDSMCESMSISTGLYRKVDLWNTNKLQLQLKLQLHCEAGGCLVNCVSPSFIVCISRILAQVLWESNSLYILSLLKERSMLHSMSEIDGTELHPFLPSAPGRCVCLTKCQGC